METLNDKLKIAQIKANSETSPEIKFKLQKKIRKLLLQIQIENIQKQIDALDA